MTWPSENDLDWIDLQLSSAVYYLNRKSRLTALLNELEPMKIRITEPVFFLGKDRQAGELLESERGPYRKIPMPGPYGFELVPQFEEIKQPMADTPTPPAPQFVTTTGQPLPPTPINKFKALADRVAKIHTHAHERADGLNKRLDAAEPAIDKSFDASESSVDGLESQVKQIEEVVRVLPGGNGNPL